MRDGNNAPIGQYFYDGEGKRVKKFITATGETTIFVYSNGKLVAEYSNNIAGPSEAKIAYTTTDHLGSPRVITDDIGQVRSRRDFLPFGEEINAGIGGRTGESGQGYSVPTDGVRQKFTGYQKDTETSLDFAEARMYANRFGRFTAVDPLLASGKSANPQTFNRYGYVLNNPLVMIDPDGEKPVYVVKHGKPGYASWYWVESTSKSYGDLKRKGYEDYKGPTGEIIHSYGKYYQLTDRGFQEAKPPTNSGEKNFDSGNNPFVGLNVFGSAFDNVVPFGQQLRHKLGFNIVDENSKEYNNFGTAATIAQLPFLIKSLPSLGSKVLGKADDGLELGSAMFRTADDAGAASRGSVGSFEQYALTARQNGYYPVMQRGFKDPVGTVWLNKGDVWKFGQTKNPSFRYPVSFLDNTGAGLNFTSQFSAATRAATLEREFRMITNYERNFGLLPAGNKIRR